MCGRYHIDDGLAEEIENLVLELEPSIRMVQAGDIYPSSKAPVIWEKEGLKAGMARWGFSVPFKKGILFNARAESAAEKPTFSEAVRRSRCIIPARSFYEWDPRKEKYTFYREGHSVMFLAGFYHMSGEEEQFVVLTTAANPSMKPVHDRMPLILERNEIEDWIFDWKKAEHLLKQEPPELHASTEYSQMRLEF